MARLAPVHDLAGWTWLLIGRFLLVAAPATIPLAHWTRPSWIVAERLGELDGPTLPMLITVVQFAAALGWPALLLPIASPGLARQDGNVLIGRTVLGLRRVDLARATTSEFALISGSKTTRVHVLRQGPRIVVFIDTYWDAKSGFLHYVRRLPLSVLVYASWVAGFFLVFGGLSSATGILSAWSAATP